MTTPQQEDDDVLYYVHKVVQNKDGSFKTLEYTPGKHLTSVVKDALGKEPTQKDVDDFVIAMFLNYVKEQYLAQEQAASK